MWNLWHADLYRLSGPADCEELGLPDAFETAICLVEWPDRLGELSPPGALHLTLEPRGDTRDMRFQTNNARWRNALAAVATE